MTTDDTMVCLQNSKPSTSSGTGATPLHGVTAELPDESSGEIADNNRFHETVLLSKHNSKQRQ